MSWHIYVDAPGHPKRTVSDGEYAGIDFGNGADDHASWTNTDGSVCVIYLDNVSSILCVGGVTPAPGVYPGWEVHAHGTGGSTNYHVDNVTKEALVLALQEEDARVEFETLEGYTIHLYTRNLHFVHFEEDELLIPEPD